MDRGVVGYLLSPPCIGVLAKMIGIYEKYIAVLRLTLGRDRYDSSPLARKDNFVKYSEAY